MPAGLTPDGAQGKTTKEILDALKIEMQEVFGEGVSLDSSSPDMQNLGFHTARYVAMWNLIISIYNQLDPRVAQGQALDLINEGVRGVPRQRQSKTKVTVELTGDPAATIPAGTVFSSSTNTELAQVTFSTNIEITLDGSGDGVVVCTCSDFGAYEVASNDIDTIDTPVSGLDTVDNSAAGVTGTDEEDDATYRIRGDESHALPSQSMVESLISGLLSLAGVEKVKVYENRTTSTDGNGVPAHSMAIYVRGGIQQEILEMIFNKYNLGPGLEGDQTGTVYDEYDNAYTIKYYVPTEVAIEVEVDVKEVTGWTLGKVEDIRNAVSGFYDGTLDQEGVEPGYQIADTLYAADLYAPVGVVDGQRINTIGIRKQSVGGSYLGSIALAWNEYPVIVDPDANITVPHAP